MKNVPWLSISFGVHSDLAEVAKQTARFGRQVEVNLHVVLGEASIPVPLGMHPRDIESALVAELAKRAAPKGKD